MNPFARPRRQGPFRGARPLSEVELREIDDFLLSDATSDETMVLEVLDGYLTALVVGPVTAMPSLWLPRVWGPVDEDAPEFDTVEQAQRIVGLILKHMNSIIGSLEQDPGSHEPMMSTRTDPASGRECLDGEMWAHGFMDGVALCRGDWEPLLNDAAGSEALRPIRLLGADDLTTEEQSLIRTVVQREKLSQEVRASLLTIYRFWLPYRQERQPIVRRGTAKIARNDPCPCGSGRKFKQCCGTNRDREAT